MPKDLRSEAQQVHDLVSRAQPRRLVAALERFATQGRDRDPLAMLLRAMQRVLEGDVPGAMSMLRRTVWQGHEPAASYASDLLVPLLITAARYEEAEAVLQSIAAPVPELIPGFTALRGVLAARYGERDLSRHLGAEAVRNLPFGEYCVVRANVIQRNSLAAYYRHEYRDALEYGLDAARLSESLEAFRIAAIAYSVPFSVAQGIFCDPVAALHYARRMVANSRRAEDASWENYGLVAQLDLAAETGDARRLARIRAQLLAKELHEQYSERYYTVLSGVLADGWAARFEQALAALSILRGRPGSTAGRALCDALTALYSVTIGDVGTARQLARKVLGQTVGSRRRLTPTDADLANKARLIAVATCLILGDSVRGKRALSSDVDPTGALLTYLSARGIDEERVPIMLRGYARAINAAASATARNRPSARLTVAELRILRALPEGATLAAIAAELGKSSETVKKQVRSIYTKLEVCNRTQAIERARELRLLAI